MHFGIGYAYLQTITANVFHYFTTKYCDYFLLKHRVNESYLVRKLLSFTGTPFFFFRSPDPSNPQPLT